MLYLLNELNLTCRKVKIEIRQTRLTFWAINTVITIYYRASYTTDVILIVNKLLEEKLMK